MFADTLETQFEISNNKRENLASRIALHVRAGIDNISITDSSSATPNPPPATA
jgi:hypothetical protein